MSLPWLGRFLSTLELECSIRRKVWINLRGRSSQSQHSAGHPGFLFHDECTQSLFQLGGTRRELHSTGLHAGAPGPGASSGGPGGGGG